MLNFKKGIGIKKLTHIATYIDQNSMGTGSYRT